MTPDTKGWVKYGRDILNSENNIPELQDTALQNGNK